ncbi:hypothetical protein BC827DRAFT_1387632 [Russula dissimulans]|nr:hypothetical protein BC827DRAFT_1387632 [Russula dissimulans]
MTEEFFAPKRWVDEQKRKAFSCYCDLAGYPTIPECDVQDFHRNLVHLDQILANIEKYIHFSFAALRKEVVVRRMFSMVSEISRPDFKFKDQYRSMTIEREMS